jgi:hypothetical protein
MADLEELAVKRDRRYLVRLVLMLCVGLCASVFLFQVITGKRTSGCVAGALLGQPDPAQGPDVGN